MQDSLVSKCVDHGRQGNRDGYTMMKHNGRTVLRHRVVYCLHNGLEIHEIKGLLVRHTCDNPRCVNPQHLLTGTAQDNSNDMISRNRQARGVRNGMSKLTPEKVRYIREHYKPYDKLYGALPLSKVFGVSTTAIRYANMGRSWGYIDE